MRTQPWLPSGGAVQPRLAEPRDQVRVERRGRRHVEEPVAARAALALDVAHVGVQAGVDRGVGGVAGIVEEGLREAVPHPGRRRLDAREVGDGLAHEGAELVVVHLRCARRRPPRRARAGRAPGTSTTGRARACGASGRRRRRRSRGRRTHPQMCLPSGGLPSQSRRVAVRAICKSSCRPCAAFPARRRRMTRRPLACSVSRSLWA